MPSVVILNLKIGGYWSIGAASRRGEFKGLLLVITELNCAFRIMALSRRCPSR